MSKNVKIDGRECNGISSIQALDVDTNEYVSFVDTSDATATADDILKDKTAYVNGEKVIGTGASIEIVQTTGDSESAVMSQKATTDEIATLKSDLTNAKKTCYELRQTILGDYKIGAWSTDGYINEDVIHVLSSVDIVSFDRDICLECSEAFRFTVALWEGGVIYNTISDTTKAYIGKGKQFTISVWDHPFDAQVKASNKCISAVTFDTAYKDKIEQISDKQELFDSAFTINKGTNLFNKDDDGIVYGKYINAETLIEVNSDYTFISHAIRVRSGTTYTFPKFNVLGETAIYVYKCDLDGSIIKRIVCENINNAFIKFECDEDCYIKFVGAMNIINRIGFYNTDVYPLGYRAYNDDIILSENVVVPRKSVYRKALNEDIDRQIYIGSEHASIDDLLDRLPFSSVNFSVLDDMEINFDDYPYLSYEIINGHKYVVANLTANKKVSFYKTIPTTEIYDNLVCAVYVRGVSSLSQLDIVPHSNSTDNVSFNIPMYMLKEGWNLINIGGTLVGNPDKSAIIMTGFRATTKDIDGAECTVKIGRVYTFNRKPLVSIWFDDALRSVYDFAYPLMRENNMRGAMAVISGVVGKKGFMKKNEIIDLKNDGWDLCNHTHYPQSLLDMTTDKAVYSIARGREYLASIGVGQSKDYLVLPQGDVNDEIKVAAKPYYSLMRYAGNTHQSVKYARIPFSDWDNIPCLSVNKNTTIDDVKQYIQKCVEQDAWGIILFHTFSQSGVESDIDWSKSAFTEFINYISQLRDNDDIYIVTPSEAINLM